MDFNPPATESPLGIELLTLQYLNRVRPAQDDLPAIFAAQFGKETWDWPNQHRLMTLLRIDPGLPSFLPRSCLTPVKMSFEDAMKLVLTAAVTRDQPNPARGTRKQGVSP